MALRTIIEDGDPRLRKVSRGVDNIQDERIQTLIDDMIDSLRHSGNGIGLAAVQVGVLRRIFIIDLGDGEGLRVYINPEFLEKEGEQIYTEGCLSLPGYWGKVRRPARVKIAAYNREGERFEREAEGLEAVCICHEYDHLDGILFQDHVFEVVTAEQLAAEAEAYEEDDEEVEA